MKKLGIALAFLTLAGVVLGTASARTDAGRTICHRIASKTRPYVKLRVSAKQLRAHLAHPADIVPAPSGSCPRTLLSPTSGGRAFDVALTGEAESPNGDPVATGTATVRLRAGQGQVCYQLAANNLPTAAVAAHIHRAAAGTSGPVVVPLRTPDAASGRARGCTTTPRTLVNAILGSPGSYYVNVHTSDFPNGAVRGQLTGTSTASFGKVLSLTLKGTSEPNAKGTAVLRIRKDTLQVCYRLHAESVTLPTTAAHIHRGGAGVDGPVVVPFSPPGADGNSSGCTTTTADLINEMLANLPGFYVNVHTREHPAGAIRAQLG